MGTKAEELIKLARKNYRYLSEAELKLLRKVAEGEGADYRSSDQTENDPKEGYSWGQKRSPDINVIIWLCTDKEAIECLTHKGISITGAKIDGCLDLDFIDLDVPLIFHCCYFSEGIRLKSAKVKLLDFSGSYITSSGYTIFAQSADIKGDVYLNNDFQAEGEVSFYAATIGGGFRCDNGSFNKAKKGDAISIQNANIQGSVFLNKNFQADGKVNLIHATISKRLILSEVQSCENMILDLRFTTIETLDDKENSWPKKNKLYLEGLVYNSISSDPDSTDPNESSNEQKPSPVDSQSRLKWIRLQNLEENFSPQPYEQLAKVLRMSGHEEAAKDILIAKQNDRRRYGELKGFSWVLNYVLGLTIDHGYRPQKIFRYLLLLIIVGSLIFSWGESHNLMSPSKIRAYNQSEKNCNTNQQQTISDDYPKFHAFMYSVDALVPVIDFHQESYWLPNGNKSKNTKMPTVYLDFSTSNPLPKLNIAQANTGNLLRWYFWFHIAMGWVLTSLAVAGFTGLVRLLG